jgi:4-amino-4-deoxy-L-arabinose transferase-like glycosyltransferase
MAQTRRRTRNVLVVGNRALALKIGTRIRQARLRAGQTQAELAKGRYTAAARWRLGDWSRRRDPLMLAWMVVFGAAVIALMQGPPDLITTVPPLILIGAGAYLVAVHRESRSQPHWLAGWLAGAYCRSWLVSR